MQIRILGCSGGISGVLRTTCLLVDHDILIDAGTGVGDLTLAEMARIRHIFLTHSHLDHIAGLPLMVDSIFGQISEPVTIHASAETLAALREHIFNWAIWPDFTVLPTAQKGVLRYQLMEPGSVLTMGTRHFHMIPVNHIVPGVGYCIEAAGRVLAFTGDTTTNDTFWAALNDYSSIDAVIAECAFANQEHDLCIKARHYCPGLLAADLAKLKHRPQVYLTHLKPGAEAQIERECQELIKDFAVRRLYGGDVIPL